MARDLSRRHDVRRRLEQRGGLDDLAERPLHGAVRRDAERRRRSRPAGPRSAPRTRRSRPTASTSRSRCSQAPPAPTRRRSATIDVRQGDEAVRHASRRCYTPAGAAPTAILPSFLPTNDGDRLPARDALQRPRLRRHALATTTSAATARTIGTHAELVVGSISKRPRRRPPARQPERQDRHGHVPARPARTRTTTTRRSTTSRP